jgi:hypothetical protein
MPTDASAVSILVPADLATHVQHIVDHIAAFRNDAAAEPDFAAGELRLMTLVAGLETAALGSMLASLDPTAPRIEFGGRTYRRLNQRAESTYVGLRGEVQINRGLYRQEKLRNGPTVVPLDLRAGIVDGRFTPAAAEGLARVAQAIPSREAETMCASLGVLPVSRSTHFRVGVSVGGRWEELRDEVEPILADQMELPETAAAMSVSVDRISLPMAEAREPTPEDVEAGVVNPISVNFRMAFTAVWTLYDKDGVPLIAVRYAHVPTDGALAMERCLARDIDAVLRRRPSLQLVTLADGAPEMQSILDRAVGTHPVAARLVDFWHLIEHLGKANAAVRRFSQDLVHDWKADLLERDEAIDQIEAELHTWSLNYPDDAIPEGLYDALTYIENHRERLRYATVHAAALPIGSGTVEATGKTVVEVRMKRAGARWAEPGAQAIMGLRSLATSDAKRWGAAIKQVLASYRHEVRLLSARDASVT